MCLPIGIANLITIPTIAAFAVVVAADFLCGIIIPLWTIPFYTYTQKTVPSELLGKVMSLFTALPFLASGLGYMFFGILFQQFLATAHLIIFITAFVSFVPVLFLQKYFRKES
jgi:hypothetical protein